MPEAAPHFCVIGYNPNLDTEAGHEPGNQAKCRHIRHIAHHFQVEAREIMLFDDAPGNVEVTSGYLAFQVDRETAFTLSQANAQLQVSLDVDGGSRPAA